MRILKDKILRTKEFTFESQDLYSELSSESYGSAIYQLSTEDYETLKNMDPMQRLNELTSSNSKFTKKRIGLICPDLLGSPLILYDKADKFSTRSFVFIFKNKSQGIAYNDCEIVDNYPDIFEARDISKYSGDQAFFTDVDFASLITSLMDNTSRFFHVQEKGFLLHDTPKQKEQEEQMIAHITHGKTKPRRQEITKEKAVSMLEEAIYVDNPDSMNCE